MLCLLAGIGTAVNRASRSLMLTLHSTIQLCAPLAAHGLRQSADVQHAGSRDGSNSRSYGLPSSPARSSRLCASSAAAQSMRRPYEPSFT
eukprot:5563384-Pleurochrysis_carterae.AAC.1